MANLAHSLSSVDEGLSDDLARLIDRLGDCASGLYERSCDGASSLNSSVADLPQSSAKFLSGSMKRLTSSSRNLDE
ncbi:hypothetical protein RvY_14936 [Ramazzottius varieornatus]|uniref:Uncharacterized protein n=1 Tax=Ramazzottius varieornatus TaxID=947166 RepID=A0A1D1W1D2_RAMVA|nr:hypothetical protein RvY_14936 [Ramazzottius varieornatus]